MLLVYSCFQPLGFSSYKLAPILLNELHDWKCTYKWLVHCFIVGIDVLHNWGQRNQLRLLKIQHFDTVFWQGWCWHTPYDIPPNRLQVKHAAMIFFTTCQPHTIKNLDLTCIKVLRTLLCITSTWHFNTTSLVKSWSLSNNIGKFVLSGRFDFLIRQWQQLSFSLSANRLKDHLIFPYFNSFVMEACTCLIQDFTAM